MTSGETNNSEQNWLVKSSMRILGPFDLDQIKELLRTKQISIIDEIRSPRSRWGYIRENKMFLDIVKDLRDEQDTQAENTMTMSHSISHQTPTQTITQTITQTNNSATPYSDDLTPTPPPSFPRPNMQPPPTPDIRDITPSEGSVPSRSSSAEAKSYGTRQDPRLQQQIHQRSLRIRWILMIVGFAAIAGAVAVIWPKHREENSGFDEYIVQAIRYKGLGLYERSLQAYKKALLIREPDFTVQAQMAPVLISEDHQTVPGRRVLEKALINESTDRNQATDAYLGIAISYILDGDLHEADGTLQKALGYDPTNFSVQMDVAIVALKKGNYSEAEKRFDDLYKKNPQSLLALFYRSMAVAEVVKTTPEKSSLIKQMVPDLKSAISKTNYLKQELTMMMIYMDTQLGDSTTVQTDVAQFLSQVPSESEHYSKSLFVDWRMTQWDYLERYCGEVYNKWPTIPRIKALRAECLLEVNRDTEAQKLLQEAVAEAVRDPFVMVAQANYMIKTGHTGEARTILGTPDMNAIASRDRLLTQICLANQDQACVQQSAVELHNMNKQDVLSLYGLAWLAKRNKDRMQAYDYIRDGLQLEPNYIPLIELRDALEAD